MQQPRDLDPRPPETELPVRRIAAWGLSLSAVVTLVGLALLPVAPWELPARFAGGVWAAAARAPVHRFEVDPPGEVDRAVEDLRAELRREVSRELEREMGDLIGDLTRELLALDGRALAIRVGPPGGPAVSRQEI